MKTLAECKNQVAKKYDYTNWNSILLDNIANNIIEYYEDEVSTLYAKEVAQQALIDASENAKVWCENEINGTEFDILEFDISDDSTPFIEKVTVSKDSILNTLIKLL